MVQMRLPTAVPVRGMTRSRFEVTAQCLAPQLGSWLHCENGSCSLESKRLITPLSANIPIPITKEKPYSIDQNLWGCAIECGEMEDLWTEPPSDAWIMTQDPTNAPRGSFEIVLSFEAGIPVAIDGVPYDGVALIGKLNEIAGQYGVGRIDMVENRVVGLKSREVYEAPGASLIHMAHTELERIVLDRATFHYSRKLAQDYANIIYNGLWFGPLRQCLDGFFAESQKNLTGEVQLESLLDWLGSRVGGLRIPFMMRDLRPILMVTLLIEPLPKAS